MTQPPTATGIHDLRDLHAVLDEYRTCELATMTRGGVPVAWPAVCDIAPAGDRIVLTTSIAFPQKAFNIRRDPRVALLFSDPTGTGRTDLPHVLVRGTATCPATIHTGTGGLDEYWRRLSVRQPASTVYGRTAIGRRLFDWYYMRLVITVTPREVITMRPPAGDGPMRTPEPARSDPQAFTQLCRELPGYDSAVLGTATAGEFPVLRRVRLRADPAAGAFVVQGPETGMVEGAASILMHRHDDALWNQRQIGVFGELHRLGETWLFRPDRLLPNQFPSNPVELARVLIRARRAASRYLDRRGLARPPIDWAAHRACERG
jgi:hypothetical protein